MAPVATNGSRDVANHRIKHWTVRRSRRRIAGYWEIRNTHGVVAVVYTTEADAREMANALKYKGSLKHMVAIVRLRTDLRASERAKYEAAVKLVAEVSA